MTQDLFNDDDLWEINPLLAFGTFVKSDDFIKLGRRKKAIYGEVPTKPMRTSAMNVYKSMFSKFVRWSKGKPINRMSDSDIVAFLDHHEQHNGKDVKRMSSLIRVRYLRLLERIYTYRQIQPNPATVASKYLLDQSQMGRDAPKAALTTEQQYQFIQNLPEAPAYQLGVTDGWKKRRDRAIQAMMLGAGLKVSEVINLYVENIGMPDTSGSVPITISPASVDGTGRWHQTQLRPFAVKIVLDWMEERRALKLPTKLAFPAALSHSKPLDKATVYRHVQQTFKRAGISISREGGRTLRNSFAARELSDETASLELVGEFLGLRKLKSTAKYKQKKSHLS